MHGALKYLGSRQDVIADKVAVIGWSRGGTSTLAALRSEEAADEVDEPRLKFAAAVAYYPNCFPSGDMNSPLLIVMGDRDGEPGILRGSVTRCRNLVAGHTAGDKPIEFEVYENATHAFDYYFEKVPWQGAIIDRNPVAAEAAIKRVKEFLERQLR